MLSRTGCCVCLAALVSLFTRTNSWCDEVAWVGKGDYRLLVKVDPLDMGGRVQDERPAELEVDIAAELGKLGVSALPDMASLQVMQYDPRTKQPIPYSNYAYQTSEHDRPFRWYDAAIPYDFPEFANAVTRTQGKIVRRSRVRGGYFFNVLGDWKKGRIVWLHTQSRDEPSWYAMYFDLLPAGTTPSEIPPRSWIGDGTPRCDQTGGSTMGADHCRLELDDFNDDGLIDLIVGENYGHVLWWPNRGTKHAPSFPYSKFVLNAEGLPLDAGMTAAPKVVDWNGDGNKDLLVGTEWNRVLFYQNVGTNRARKLEYHGYLQADGQTLQLPVAPLERGSEAVFRRDYYPVLETVDWEGDGDLDLLAGGYVTGRIYLYENTGRTTEGLPQLVAGGPLRSDAQPLNVGHWCAAPSVADFDGDGDLDLISGNMPMYVAADERGELEFLRYYENRGTRSRPQLRRRPFPATGQFPRSHLASPRAFDWDNDGDLDLVVSARENIFLFENQGTKTKPHFHAHQQWLPSRWGSASLAVDQFRDWDGDGRLDLVKDYTVRLNSGAGNPWRWQQTLSVLPSGQYIEHPSGVGDDWFWPRLDDLDQDGRLDVLFGDWYGHVWFHRNQTIPGQPSFDIRGVKLATARGKAIKVGPKGKDPDQDFDALQGARTVFTVADFDRDGLRDLVVGDTYGLIHYYRNIGTRANPLFDEPVEIGDLGIRLLLDSTDWNDDGWMDVIAGAANGRVRVFLNTASQGAKPDKPFAEGIDPGLPPIEQPRVIMADLNGDGDQDLFLPSTQGACFVERSFLKQGYAPGLLISIEERGAK